MRPPPGRGARRADRHNVGRRSGRLRAAKGPVARIVKRAIALGRAVPAIIAAQAPEVAGGEQRRQVDGFRRVLIGCDIDRVGLAIELAHEAGLALIEPCDHGDAAIFARVQHMGRAGGDACIAACAAIRDDLRDHAAISAGKADLVSKRVQTVSSPPASKRRPSRERAPADRCAYACPGSHRARAPPRRSTGPSPSSPPVHAIRPAPALRRGHVLPDRASPAPADRGRQRASSRRARAPCRNRSSHPAQHRAEPYRRCRAASRSAAAPLCPAA